METIVIFTDWYKPGFKAGGPVQSVFNLAELLSKHFVVKVVTRNTDLNSQSPYTGIQANIWNKYSETHQVLYLDAKNTNFSIIKQIVKENRDNKILINGLYSFYFSLLPTLFSVMFNVKKTFVAVRGMLHASALSVKPMKKQVFLSFARGFGLYNKVDMLATNDEEVKEIRRIFRKSSIKIAPNIPLNYQAPKLDNYQRNKVFKIIYVGRIAPEKNPMTLIDALFKLEHTCEVVFCGGGNDPAYLKEFTSKLDKLPKNITRAYLPNVKHEDVINKMANSDVMVLTSLGENFAHAIYESLVVGTPVIIGNNTPWKHLENYKAGFEIEPTDVNALIEYLKFFISMDDNKYLEWRAGANSVAKTYCEKNNFEQIYLKLFS